MARRYTFNNIEVDVEGFRLLKEGRQLPVEPKALNLLIFLLDHRGKLLERRAIIDAVWGGAFVSDHVLNRAVGQLRKLLDDDSKQPRYIETVPTLGYRFIADVKVKVDETSDSPPDVKPAAGPLADYFTPSSGSKAPVAPLAAAAKAPASWRRLIASSVIFVVAAACVAGFWALKKSGAREAPIRSLAVLPLENLSGDNSQEYVADGMTAQLITGLAQIRALRVISQTTAMQYKNAHKALPQIAKELNVDAVVEGSVMRTNDQIRISAQLVNAPGDKQLWAGSYNGDLRDIVGVENQVASAVAERIRIQLSPQERMQLAGTRPVNPRASEAFFKGEAALEINTLGSEKQAVQFYAQAVQLDPSFARAYVGLARSYNYLAGWGGFAASNGIAVGEATAAADAALAKALEIDPGLGEAYEERAWTVAKFRWDFPSAEAGFRQALQLEPGAPSAHDGLALTLLIEGRFDDALHELDMAQELDPLSLVVNTDYCRALQYAHQDERALAQCDATIRLGPDYSYALFETAQLHERLGDYAEGHRLWSKVQGGCDAPCLAMVDEIHGRPGVTGAFDAWLKRLKRPPETFFFARAYAGLHRKDQAFEWLEKSYELHSDVFDMVFLAVDPDFDSLRSDPRFDAFLRHVGLPPQPHLLSNMTIKN